MTDDHLALVLAAGFKEAGEAAKDHGADIQLLAMLSYATGLHQSTALLMRWDGDVTPHRFNKVLRDYLHKCGIGIVVPTSSSGENPVPKSPPAN
jgi:hypothetical protein